MQLSGPIILIKNSFRLFFKRENLVFFIEIYVFLVISQAASSFLLGKLNVYTDIQNGTLPPLSPQLTLAVITGLVFMVINTFFSVSGYEAVRRIVWGQVPDIKATLLTVWKKIWKVAVVSFLWVIIITLGLILLIVPGIIFSIWFKFAIFETLGSDIGIKEAFLNSKNLVAGRFWPVLGRTIAFGLFAGATQMVLSFIPLGYGIMITTLIGALFVLPSCLLYKELKG